MKMFRLLLATLFILLAAYTSIVVSNHGINLFPVFFGDIAKLGWPGQFNLDFTFMLILSATWVSWRSGFSFNGLILGMLALFGGASFLSLYLLWLTIKTNGDTKKILLGVHHASA